jgi:hypothetical protein
MAGGDKNSLTEYSRGCAPGRQGVDFALVSISACLVSYHVGMQDLRIYRESATTGQVFLDQSHVRLVRVGQPFLADFV